MKRFCTIALIAICVSCLLIVVSMPLISAWMHGLFLGSITTALYLIPIIIGLDMYYNPERWDDDMSVWG